MIISHAVFGCANFLSSAQSTTYNAEYFHAFIQACPRLWDIPVQPLDDRQRYLHHFFSRLAPLHASPDSTCFAATETFAFDFRGTPSLLAFLAVLREQFDIYRPQQIVDGTMKCRKELLCDLVVLPISNLNMATKSSAWCIPPICLSLVSSLYGQAGWRSRP